MRKWLGCASPSRSAALAVFLPPSQAAVLSWTESKRASERLLSPLLLRRSGRCFSTARWSGGRPLHGFEFRLRVRPCSCRVRLGTDKPPVRPSMAAVDGGAPVSGRRGRTLPLTHR